MNLVDQTKPCLLQNMTRAACSVLMLMTIEIESKLPVMEQCGEVLVKLLDDQDSGISKNATACLRNVVEHLTARRMVEDKLGGAVMVEYLGELPSAPPDYNYNVTAY